MVAEHTDISHTQGSDPGSATYYVGDFGQGAYF